MRQPIIVNPIVPTLILGSVLGLCAKPSATPAPDSEAILAAAREIAQKVRYCGLVTIDAAGQPHVRAMDPFPPDDRWQVVLATHRSTRKVEEIRNHPEVALYYFDPDSPGYVTLRGKARIVDDQRMKELYWKEEWTAFYEDGNRGEDYLLIEVTPLRLEIMSIAHDIAADPKGWKPATVEFPS